MMSTHLSRSERIASNIFLCYSVLRRQRRSSDFARRTEPGRVARRDQLGVGSVRLGPRAVDGVHRRVALLAVDAEGAGSLRV